MLRINNVKHQQWDKCQTCFMVYPMSDLRVQDGRRVCIHGCWDPRPNGVRFREISVGLILSSNNAPEEGTDRRWIDFAFQNVDETPK